MRNLQIEEMESVNAGKAVGCIISSVVLVGAFVGLGACTMGAGWAAAAIFGYGASLAGLTYECSH